MTLKELRELKKRPKELYEYLVTFYNYLHELYKNIYSSSVDNTKEYDLYRNIEDLLSGINSSCLLYGEKLSAHYNRMFSFMIYNNLVDDLDDGKFLSEKIVEIVMNEG